MTDAPRQVAAGPVRLEVDDHGFGTITVGDQNISKLVGEVTIRARVGQATLVHHDGTDTHPVIAISAPVLAFIAEGHRHIKLRDDERAALISLGWTPPAGDSEPTPGK